MTLYLVDEMGVVPDGDPQMREPLRNIRAGISMQKRVELLENDQDDNRLKHDEILADVESKVKRVERLLWSILGGIFSLVAMLIPSTFRLLTDWLGR